MDQAALKFIDLIQTVFDQMSEQMGVALPQVWSVLIKQEYVVATQIVFGLVVGWLAFLFFWKFGYNVYKDQREEIYRGEMSLTDTATMFHFAYWICFVLLVFLTVVFGLQAVGRLINPEYYALQSILSMIKK